MEKKITGFLIKQKKLIVFFIIYSIANSLFITLVSLFAKEIVNSMIVENKNLLRDFIYYSLAGIALITIAYFTKLFYTNKSYRIITNLQKDIFDWIKRSDLYQTRDMDTGEVITSITNDTKKLGTFLCEDFSGVIDSILVFIVMSCTCIYFNKTLFLFTMICSIINGFVVFFVKKIENSEYIIRKSEQNIKSLNLQIFRGIPILDLFSGTKELLKKCTSQMEHICEEEQKKVRWESIYALLSWGSNMVREVGIIVIAPLILKLDLGSAMAIINVSSYLNSSLAALGEYILNMQQVNVAYKHIIQISEMPMEERTEFGKRDIEEIELHNVSYSYDGNKKAVKNVSFKIEKGSYIAIRGEIGAGKTTLLKLLLGFIFPTEGEITLDGIPITKQTTYKLRELTAYVDQENSLVEGTILQNLCGFQEDRYSGEKIEKVLEKVNLKERIESLDEGLQTFIGQNGLMLSGGEKQRLCIARAFLKDSKFLIIDEPTSALDGENEKLIQNIIETERSKRGIVVVTHNPKFVENADQVIYL